MAPLGISFFPTSLGGSRSTPTSITAGGFSSGELCDTEALRNRMEQISAARGLEGVTVDCANLLNNGLDAYLKRIITSCVDLVGARSGQEPVNPRAFKKQSHGNMVNAVSPENDLHLLSTSGSSNTRHEPRQLGEDWPSLLEKACLRSFQE
ncbi:unnamed protein product [Spirodela intermedia]|uniref:Uncharacterized protein n=1 Tax=Spirodela intermedia TaxID=51605 RepID=A0A7I8JQX7_SPIIN|nr:unnamed protein product [Spirodela intermedia]CAA6672185.1 unnamed protein product [Spirodela intermedia]